MFQYADRQNDNTNMHVFKSLSMFQYADRQNDNANMFLVLSTFQYANRQNGFSMKPVLFVDIILALSMFQHAARQNYVTLTLSGSVFKH